MGFYDSLKSRLERFLLRGVMVHLLVVATMIGGISVIAGLLVRIGVHDAGSVGDSIWWAFLRLTDPGYLGDDVGVVRRVISTVVTVLGYVLFMGSLVAIMTQWLNQTIRHLEGGYTHIARKNHILILGWTARSPIVLRDLLLSEARVHRFLERIGLRRLHVVLMADEVNAALMRELRGRVGECWDSDQVTLRSGTPLRGDHLLRVDFLRASAVILPAGEHSGGGLDHADTHTIKALLSMSSHPSVQRPEQLPLVIAELLDSRRSAVARGAYRGPIEVLSSDLVVAQMIAQNIRHRALSYVYTELLTHREGNEIYARELPQLTGERFGALRDRLPLAIAMGVVRRGATGFVAHLNPAQDFVLESGDCVVVMAGDYEDAGRVHAESRAPISSEVIAVPRTVRHDRRVLIMGWSFKVPSLLNELVESAEGVVVDIVSSYPAKRREKAIERVVKDLRAVKVRHIQADFSVPHELADVAPELYDNVVILGSDRLGSGEEADARTIVGYLVLQGLLEGRTQRPDVMVELLDPGNVNLLGQRPGDILVSPVIISHMLAQVALRRELHAVFDDLFASGGSELAFRPGSAYGHEDGVSVTFASLMEDAARHGEIALGYLLDGAGDRPRLHLNPDREVLFKLGADDRIVVLSSEP